MSASANPEGFVTYSFTHPLHFLRMETSPVVKDHRSHDDDSWKLVFTHRYCGRDDKATLSLTKKTDGDCSYNVKMSIVDAYRQSTLELIKTAWKDVGSSESLSIPSGFGSYSDQITVEITKIPKPSMVEVYSNLFKSESFGDVVIECSDGEKFRCHKDMLAARSPVFATMFNVKMKESVENRIRIQDFNNDVIAVLLRFVYLGDWGDLSNVADRLYVAADRYQLKQLKLVCAAELIAKVNAESIVSTLRLAQLYKDESLMDGCVEYLANHKGKLSSMEVFAEAAKSE